MIKRILETVLLASGGPMTLAELKRVFEVELSNDFLRRALEELRADWQGRGVELVQLAEGWRFQTKAEYPALSGSPEPGEAAALFARHAGNPGGDRLSSAGDARRCRGNSRCRGQHPDRQNAGRTRLDRSGRPQGSAGPAGLFGTTRQFLSDLGLRALSELPPLPELAKDMQAARLCLNNRRRQNKYPVVSAIMPARPATTIERTICHAIPIWGDP
jgi:segregation and condensation protein B